MGNDGGSIPDRRDLVKNKPKAEQADKANQVRARWFFCALSKRPLQEPIVSCALGKLYNKDAIIEYLLDKSAYGDGEEICGHIRSLKDIKALKLTSRSTPPQPADSTTDIAQFICPLNLKEMNGATPFVYVFSCGCVFSQAGLRTVLGASPSRGTEDDKPNGTEKENGNGNGGGTEQLDVCPQCATKFLRSEDVLTINPSPAEEERMRMLMDLRRAREPPKVKSKKRKAGAGPHAVVEEVDTVAKKVKKGKGLQDGPSPSPTPAPSLNPKVSAASRALSNSLAAEEVKRKAGMSEAVKSLYRDKNGPQKKETFTTMGTFTRYA